jgi:hypothetical protein
MGVRRLNSSSTGFSVKNFRPAGYVFPVGLNGANAGTPTTDIVTTTPSPGNYTFPGTAASGTAEVLVIGGGGGGGSILGGGGGGGGLVYHSAYPFSAGQSVSIGVGSGGITYGPGSPSATGPTSTKGGNTSFGSITAVGGGAGRASGGGSGSTTDVSGGSSGGGNYYDGPTGGSTTTVQQAPSGGGTGYGYAGAGGSGYNPANPGGTYNLGGGGGGGAGGAAQTNPLSAPDAPYKASSGNGGAGLAFSLVGSSVNYSGGGGGQYQHRAGSQSNGQTIDGSSANNTGSFGIGATAQLLNGGAMPGAVIIKYYTNTYSIN